MYEQKYNRYKFKYLCLQLQQGGYNPLTIPPNQKQINAINEIINNRIEIIEKDKSEKIKKRFTEITKDELANLSQQKSIKPFNEEDLNEMNGILQQYKKDIENKLTRPFQYQKFDKKQNAFTINFMAAAMAVINCTKVDKVSQVSLDCKDTREEIYPADISDLAKENLIKERKKAKDELEALRKMDKCTSSETLQIVASMFLAILFHMDNKDTQDIAIVAPDTRDNFFIRNIKSMIDQKIANCKIVDPSLQTNKDAVDKKRKELAIYYNNVILQINNNLASIPKFLEEDGKNRLLSNAEYTSESKGGKTTYLRTYNKFFETYLNKLNYIRGYDIYGITNTKTYTPFNFKIPTKGETQSFDAKQTMSLDDFKKDYNKKHGEDSWEKESKASLDKQTGKNAFEEKMMKQFLSEKELSEKFNFTILDVDYKEIHLK
jgi:hypothetical protein